MATCNYYQIFADIREIARNVTYINTMRLTNEADHNNLLTSFGHQDGLVFSGFLNYPTLDTRIYGILFLLIG